MRITFTIRQFFMALGRSPRRGYLKTFTVDELIALAQSVTDDIVGISDLDCHRQGRSYTLTTNSEDHHVTVEFADVFAASDFSFAVVRNRKPERIR